MNIIIQSFSTNGTRDSNEDTMDLINNLNESNKSHIQILYAGVFDGHGGGSISKILVDKEKINIGKYFCNISSPIANKLSPSKIFNKKIIEPLFIRIQEKLKNYYIQSNNMGSTANIILIYPRNEKKDKFGLKVINLGDSRSVICNEHNIGNQLSLDHKPHLLSDRNRILEMGGEIEYSNDGDDPRINGMSVSRSFGDLDNKYVSQIPDIFDYNLSNDKFLILGCDGVWDVLQNQEVVDFVLEKYNDIIRAKKPLSEFKGRSEYNIAHKLADYAINKGSTDNISVMIIFFSDNMK
jgi:serine/threonine protein phosphatase PrpC